MPKDTSNRYTLSLFLALIGALTMATLFASEEAVGENGAPVRLFETSARCVACHNSLAAPDGEDISFGTSWSASMMANSARDPYWQAGVRREVRDHPESQAAIEAECSICHMPMARFLAHSQGMEGQVFANLPIGQVNTPSALLAADGASCTMCHQILASDLGQPDTFVGRFHVDTEIPWGNRNIYGPYEVDAGRQRIMGSSSNFVQTQGEHMQDSGLCASCHTLYTHSLGPGGEVIGEFPEQVPYLEWQHSRYSETNNCQSCHLRQVDGETAISSAWGQPRPNVSTHVFRGGNFFIPRILNQYRNELGTAALPLELSSSSQHTLRHLESETATVRIDETNVRGDQLRATVSIHNLAGHKLPSAYPSRRAWLHLVVRDVQGEVVFESGALNRDGSIMGNDNDADASQYEPHYADIGQPDQVQIYEAILGGPDGAVTTGLLTATQYLKDNRMLPEGFDIATADPDIAVHGAALEDGDFDAGGDSVRYQVSIGERGGPWEVTAELWYQPIGFRWAQNLAEYDAMETQRFVRYYEGAAHSSAALLATAQVMVQPPEPEPTPEPGPTTEPGAAPAPSAATSP